MKFKEFFKKNIKLIKYMQNLCPSMIPLVFGEQMIAAVQPFLSLWLGAKIIDEMVLHREEQALFRLVFLFVMGNLVLSILKWVMSKVLIVKRRAIEQHTEKEVMEKCMTMDYQVYEKSETRDMLTEIQQGQTYSGGISNYIANLGYFLYNVFAVLYSLILILPAVLSAPGEKFNLAGLLFLGLWAGLLWLRVAYTGKYKRYQQETFQDAVKINRGMGYFTGYTRDYQIGKSIRIFRMRPLILSKYEHYQKETFQLFEKNFHSNVKYDLTEIMLTILFLILGYVYMGSQVISGRITIGELTLYIGAVQTCFSQFMNAIRLAGYLDMTSGYLINYVDFQELKNEKYDGTLPVEKRLDNEYELEFINVSFHYPNSEELVLDHVNAKIHVGRKMAIVGKNGSGKSTFIKLLCRLYDPVEGEIRLNGIDIRKYDYDEYRKLFGVVFQDFSLFSYSVADNVAASPVHDDEKVWQALEMAGMKQRVESMEKKIDSYLYKDNAEDGVELSGGEAQKIAIARAIYKDAPVVILDEPTAALDPVAELEIYERLNDMVQEKTAIFISHRMSSCRFCGNIVVFDKGNIVENGSHEELLEKNGLYAQIWNAQAKYYA